MNVWRDYRKLASVAVVRKVGLGSQPGGEQQRMGLENVWEVEVLEGRIGPGSEMGPTNLYEIHFGLSAEVSQWVSGFS